MRFHCNCCTSDFTTLGDTAGRKFSFSHIILDKMFCSKCGASNRVENHRKVKHSRNRWQPKARMTDTDEYRPPNIVLSPVCQRMLMGSLSSLEGLQVNCEACPSVFMCMTGNVDDGIVESDDPEYIAREKVKQDEKNKEFLANKKRRDAQSTILRLRAELGKVCFGYEFTNIWYCRFGGTKWKLDEADIQAIVDETWDTKNTTVIKRTLDNKGVKHALARALLMYELAFIKRSA